MNIFVGITLSVMTQWLHHRLRIHYSILILVGEAMILGPKAFLLIPQFSFAYSGILSKEMEDLLVW